MGEEERNLQGVSEENGRGRSVCDVGEKGEVLAGRLEVLAGSLEIRRRGTRGTKKGQKGGRDGDSQVGSVGSEEANLRDVKARLEMWTTRRRPWRMSQRRAKWWK